jgi:LacI family transcriptional regulator
MATMVEVARIAGVSISTVSHVLNGTRHVGEETRIRVRQAIEQTGYRQDALARAMRRSRSDSIGLVVSDAGEPAFAEMAHGVEHAAAQRGLTLLLANSAEDADREERAVQTLLERRVDGLILARGAGSGPSVVKMLESLSAPVVLLDRVFAELAFDQVGADNRESARRLVAAMTASGVPRFVVIAGDTRVPTLRERLDGFFDGISDARLRADDQVVLTGVQTPELARRFRAEVASGGIPGIIACSTPLAVVALTELAALGMRTPADVAFATFDGFNFPDLFEPRLTTVRQPGFEMGVAAVELLADRLDRPGGGPRTVRLQQRIESRESTLSWNADPGT